ncbi:DUF4384 domain-containing protein [Candidatus Ferrigenium straubiae]|jgi:hypothetical protein|uniref:DUF4384 domain-containing protein n=1 Tax=Candidatus Ferrigenium straubiae TaxID=2919506 RepID=UPI003F4AAA8D
MLALFLLPSVLVAQDAPPGKDTTESSGAEAPQPKFIWGILLKFAASKAFEIFFQWTAEKMFQGKAQPLMLPRDAAVTAPGAATLVPAPKGIVFIASRVTDKAPGSPLTVDGGRENYQGAHLALLVLQPDGQTLAVRPVSAGFVSGEKFRIRIGATFEGELTLDNIDPQGERKRLYPSSAEQVVRFRSGTPVILPLEPDSFFQFDEVAGEEKLVISLRDPRAQGEAAAQTRVHRQENAQGTGLLQEVAPGKYAAIAESVALQHRQ